MLIMPELMRSQKKAVKMNKIKIKCIHCTVVGDHTFLRCKILMLPKAKSNQICPNLITFA